MAAETLILSLVSGYLPAFVLFAVLLAVSAGVVLSSTPGQSNTTSRRRGQQRSVPAGTSKETEVEEWDGTNPDVIIVGAGVVGASLAYCMGKEGRKVLVFERDLSEPDRIVGELLQPGGYLKLVELGLEDCVEGIDAVDVHGYGILMDGKDCQISYPLKDGVKVLGRAFHHGRFIMKLRGKAAEQSSVRLRQGTVTGLIEEDGVVKGVKYRTGATTVTAEVIEQSATAPLTIVCDGCFSRFRKSLSNSKPFAASEFVGLLLENCTLPFPNHGHVILANPSPVLFYPVSSTEVRCLVDVPAGQLQKSGSPSMLEYLRDFVLPQLPAAFKPSFIAALRDDNIRKMPNQIMPADPSPTPGAILLGDAFNMRHPLTGGGMTVCFSDIAVMRDMLNPLPDFRNVAAICDYSQAFYTRRKPVSSTINTLALALYRVFSASPDEAALEMRKACFDYLKLGGIFSSGPIALLSGLNPRPLSLVCHFFAVAFYGVGRLLLPIPSPHRLWVGVRLIQSAAAIILPIIRAEGVRQMFFPGTLPGFYKKAPVA